MHARAPRTARATPAVPGHTGLLLRAVLLVLVTAGVLAGLPAGAASAAAGDEVSWGVRTASNDQGSDRRNYSYDLDPGSRLSDALVIVNHDQTPLDLQVYAADAYTNAGGQLDLLGRGEESTTVGRWISLDTDHVQVPPGGQVEVPFTVEVPDNATPGDHVGGLVTSLASPEVDDGISVDRRLGVRVQLRVGGELVPDLTVTDLHVDWSGTLDPFGTGQATVGYTVRNTGNARLTAGQAVSVAGPLGRLRTAAAAMTPVPELLPGEEWAVTVPVEGVAPTVRVTAEVVLQPALQEEGGGGPVLPALTTTASAWAVPWTLLALLAVLAALVVVGTRLARARRRRRVRLADARVAEAVEQALRERAAEERPVG